MSSRGRRYDTEPKLNIKKVLATIIAIVVFVMFVISLKNLLTKKEKPQEVSTVTTYFTVYADNKWGVIDNKGKIIIEPTYDEMIVIPEKTTDIFICTYDVNYEDGTYKTKVLNSKKEEMFKNYENVEAIENHDANSIWYENDILTYKKDGKYGLINFSGKEIESAKYDKISTLTGVSKSIIVEKDGLVGLVSSTLGEMIIEPEYAEINSLGNSFDNGYIVKNKESYYGVITTDKKTILEFKYDGIEDVAGNDMYVVKEGGKLEIVNKNGELILDKGFDSISSINGEALIAVKNNKYGVIDLTGNTIIPFDYQNIKIAFDKNYIAEKSDKFGIIDSENNTIIDFNYLNMTYRKKADFVEAEKENYKTDLINNEGKVVLEDVIISEVNTDKGFIRVRSDSDYKYYNFKFEEKKSQDVLATNTIFLVKENDKYGFENKNGERVVDCIYDDATEQNEFGYAAIKKEGRWGAVKADGTVVIAPTVNLDNNLYINFIEKWHIYENSNMNIYTK